MKPNLVLVVLLAAGCAADPADLGQVERLLAAPNGRSLNGVSLNGRSLNGRSLNGRSLNGVSLNGRSLNGRSLNGVSLNGRSLNGVSLNGVSLNGRSLNGELLTGVDFIGADLQGELSDGEVLNLHIDDIYPGEAPNEDLLYHVVSYESDAGWQPLCENPGNESIPLAGVWDLREGVPGGGSKIHDPDLITFGCRGAALAKCVELGYRPWERVGLVSLDPLHQTCTRAMRADYCGDGRSYTVDGTPINIYDRLGIQVDTEAWSFEARWNVDGAMCVDDPRQDLARPLPACIAARLDPRCGRSPLGLIRTEAVGD